MIDLETPLGTWPQQDAASWCVLNTAFGTGGRFLKTWHNWLQADHRPRLLHYVALCTEPPSAEQLSQQAIAQPALAALAQELSRHWHGLLPGFHRFLLSQGQVILTLCVGEPLAMLRAQRLQADRIELCLPENMSTDEHWFLKAIAQCCRRGARLTLHASNPEQREQASTDLSSLGFQMEPIASNEVATVLTCGGFFHPSWQLKKSRAVSGSVPLPVQRCAVIGAGLAGASVADALARRGWQVMVLDQGTKAAMGASGLPVGLLASHVSADDCALSRLSRAGVRLMLQQVAQHLQINQDWAPSGVFERQIGGTPKCPTTWANHKQAWSTQGSPEGFENLGAGLWHGIGAWVKPAALVRAWLSQPGITFQGNTQVDGMSFVNGRWQLFNPRGELVCEAERVVFANACGAFELLEKMKHSALINKGLEPCLPSNMGMRGLLSWQWHSAEPSHRFPPFPVNGSGSMIPFIPFNQGLAWFMGSTYQPDTQPERHDMDNHRQNWLHLSQLLEPLSRDVAECFNTGAVQTWKGTRCITHDRLPVVGALDTSEQSSLWICAGMGSRGLSFSVLCAELLAAQMGGEPWPVEARLARSLQALRS